MFSFKEKNSYHIKCQTEQQEEQVFANNGWQSNNHGGC